ncbi:putative Tigger transposable element-derived protein 1-like 272 [Homarus americanus]|uniref:Putative Tigger transposable element-derived protein 1-like 272 n=1 Tax=Homarus americanus TaxID=6706 RepID=A0A8J5JZX5_HOMAM|nr:putative Tigger transposable element-derived protein 1-like 272 [Homarus americanus]
MKACVRSSLTSQSYHGEMADIMRQAVEHQCRSTHESVVILSLARQAGFHELESEDIEQVQASHTEEFANENLQLLTECSATEDNDEEEELQRTLTTKRMAEAFNMIQQGIQIFIDDDPNREHSSKVECIPSSSQQNMINWSVYRLAVSREYDKLECIPSSSQQEYDKQECIPSSSQQEYDKQVYTV